MTPRPLVCPLPLPEGLSKVQRQISGQFCKLFCHGFANSVQWHTKDKTYWIQTSTNHNHAGKESEELRTQNKMIPVHSPIWLDLNRLLKQYDIIFCIFSHNKWLMISFVISPCVPWYHMWYQNGSHMHLPMISRTHYHVTMSYNIDIGGRSSISCMISYQYDDHSGIRTVKWSMIS